MKPNTKLLSFKISLLFFVLFFVQLIVTRIYVMHVVLNDQSTAFVGPLYWLGLVWISLGSLFYYKSTRYKQNLLRQLLVFVVSPILFIPLIGIAYVIVVLLPLYNIAG
jgi:ABC-type enterochelin transport system permease subunit